MQIAIFILGMLSSFLTWGGAWTSLSCIAFVNTCYLFVYIDMAWQDA